MSEPTATNPQTGEKVVFRNGAWVPLGNSPAPTPTPTVTPGRVGFIPGTPDQPTPPSGYRWGQNGTLEVIPGGPEDKPAAGEDAPSGYRYKADGTLEPIPGGPADKARAGGVDPRAAALEQITGVIQKIDQVTTDADDNGGWFETGTSGAFARNWLPEGTPASDLQANVSTIQANTAFDSLQRMREASPTGGALGNVTEMELKLLQDATGALSPNQSHEQFLTNMGEVRAKYLRILEQLDPAAAARLSGGGQDDPAVAGEVPDQRYLSNTPTTYEPASGGVSSTPDPEMSARIDRLVRAGAPLQAVNAMLRTKGFDPIPPEAYDEWRAFLTENPGYEGSTAEAIRNEPLSLFEQGATALGNSAPGAYAIGAGQFLSGNTLDNLASDPEQARLAMQVAQAQNPGATFAGELSGGILAAMTGEAGLARLGMAAGLGRGLAADAAMGAANGAGMADGGNRLMGAAQGGLAAGVGSLAGSAAMKGAGRAISPSGGNLADLYAAGVRPTPGQRFVDSGLVGRAVNATEEALQSVPVIGAAIGGARQEARDQFQIGAFNQALSEIGEELPKGMKPGTDPQKFTQEAFNRVYEQARSGMRMVADEELSNDLSNLAPDINTLGPQAQNKLKAIMANSVNSKLREGVLEGDAYKVAVSDLGKHIGRLSRSAMGEDQALADILTNVRAALDQAARRNSDPAAVELLDAADAGYAKLVRIEEAAQRRGGDAGTFTPNNFDSAVQKTSGGVRSKAYIRGDAAMQDYASQGRALSDRMANSGTADRALAATTVAGGAAYLEPTTLAVLGAIGAAYAPGVRRAVKAAMSPGGPTRQAIAQRLKRRARLAGRAGAAGAVASLPGTSPSR